ncbi:hypothetical protein NUM3379_30020 [Kineococcus sp. NUM-3379]
MRAQPRLAALAALTTTACLAATVAGAAPASAAPQVQRVFGENRIQTAVNASVTTFADGAAANVVLARSEDFADSLAAGPLASDRGGPLLLTPRASLAPAVATEIRRALTPGGTVYLVGGAGALSPETETAVRNLGVKVQRVQGANRYATAVEVARLMPGADNVAVVTGLNYPDGLSAGALMGVQDNSSGETVGVVLLSQGATMPAVTRDYIVQRNFVETGYVVAVGGDAVRASREFERSFLPVAGTDRYDTSARVARQFLSGGAFFEDAGTSVGIATGENWPDALAGSAVMGFTAGPLLLTRRAALPAVTVEALRALREDAARNSSAVETALVFGGTGAVSADQDGAIAAALG